LGILIGAALIGLIPAAIAWSKGREFALWWLCGSALFIVALPHALLLSPDRGALQARALSEGMKKCRFCAEMIQSEARVCRYCGRDLLDMRPPGPVDLSTTNLASLRDKLTALNDQAIADRYRSLGLVELFAPSAPHTR
jgi:hypothetical protein